MISLSTAPHPTATPAVCSASGHPWEGSLAGPVCESRLSVEELAARAPQREGPRGALCVYGAVRGSAGCLCPVCDPALEGSCPVCPEGATTKVTERWWGRWPNGLAERGRLLGLQPGLSQGTGRSVLLPPQPLPLQAAFLLPQCLMPGHTATEYAIGVGALPPRPHPHPGQPLDPKGRSCHGLPSAPPCLSVFTLRMAPNKCCPWRPGSGSAASVIVYPWHCQGAAIPPAGLQIQQQVHFRGKEHCKHLSLGHVVVWAWRDNSAWDRVPEPRTDPRADAACLLVPVPGIC